MEGCHRCSAAGGDVGEDLHPLALPEQGANLVDLDWELGQPLPPDEQCSRASGQPADDRPLLDVCIDDRMHRSGRGQHQNIQQAHIVGHHQRRPLARSASLDQADIQGAEQESGGKGHRPGGVPGGPGPRPNGAQQNCRTAQQQTPAHQHCSDQKGGDGPQALLVVTGRSRCTGHASWFGVRSNKANPVGVGDEAADFVSNAVGFTFAHYAEPE